MRVGSSGKKVPERDGAGMPPRSGVAPGFDRLFAVLKGCASLEGVVPAYWALEKSKLKAKGLHPFGDVNRENRSIKCRMARIELGIQASQSLEKSGFAV